MLRLQGHLKLLDFRFLVQALSAPSVGWELPKASYKAEREMAQPGRGSLAFLVVWVVFRVMHYLPLGQCASQK